MSRPARQPREDLRKSIIDTTKAILDRDGVEGLSARAIAREIGYTAASIYNVFESMSDILMEVNRETLTELNALFESLPLDVHPKERLQAICLAYVDFMRLNPARWSALFAGQRQRESFPDWYVGAIDQLKGRLSDLLIAHEPGLAPETAWRLAEDLFIAIHGLVSLDVSGRLDLFTLRRAEDIARSALETMLAGILSTPALSAP